MVIAVFIIKNTESQQWLFFSEWNKKDRINKWAKMVYRQINNTETKHTSKGMLKQPAVLFILISAFYAFRLGSC